MILCYIWWLVWVSKRGFYYLMYLWFCSANIFADCLASKNSSDTSLRTFRSMVELCCIFANCEAGFNSCTAYLSVVFTPISDKCRRASSSILMPSVWALILRICLKNRWLVLKISLCLLVAIPEAFQSDCRAQS